MREENSQRIGTTLQYNSARSKNLHDFGYDGFVADDKNLDEETKTKGDMAGDFEQPSGYESKG